MSVTAMSSYPGHRPMLTPVPSGAQTSFLGRAAEAGVTPSGRMEHQTENGPLTVDIDVYEVRAGTDVVGLSPRQVELLAVFLAAPGKVWSREQLHWICWGDTTPSRRVDVQLCRIRGKVGTELFRNVRDRGWTLQQP
jgi:DNA-binding response OmpR family regulator